MLTMAVLAIGKLSCSLLKLVVQPITMQWHVIVLVRPPKEQQQHPQQHPQQQHPFLRMTNLPPRVLAAVAVEPVGGVLDAARPPQRMPKARGAEDAIQDVGVRRLRHEL
jgi:hypothetical protein